MSLRNIIRQTHMLIQHGLHVTRASATSGGFERTLELTRLEDRVLFSASAIAPVVAEMADAAGATTSTSATVSENSGLIPMADQQLLDLVADSLLPAQAQDQGTTTADAEEQTLELVFLDSTISNLEQLMADLRADSAGDTLRTLEFIVLDSQKDGIAQITSALLQYDGVDGLHIVSHGQAGRVQLGSTLLSLETLDDYRGAISAWQYSLSDRADVLVYGCSLAASEDGQRLLNEISMLTDTDVAASEDLTGAKALGGDWDFEYQLGIIETHNAAGTLTQADWFGLLAITEDAASSAATVGTDNSLIFSHTVGSGSNGLLVVAVAVASPEPVTSVTFDGTLLTFLSAITESGNRDRAELWYLLNPASGTGDIVASMGANRTFVAGATTFFGVDQVSPFGTPVALEGNGSNSSVTVASAVGEVVLDIIAFKDRTSGIVGAGQSSLWTNTNGSGGGDAWGGSSTESGAASVTMTWSSSGGGGGEWAAIAVAIRPAANAAPAATNLDAAETYTEDSSLNLTDIVVSDVDSAGVMVTLTLLDTTAGSLNTGTSGAVTSNWVAGTGVWTASGAIADVNALLAGLTFTPTANSSGDFTIATSVSDGVAAAVTGMKSMSGIAVNDAPTLSAGTGFNGINEDNVTNAGELVSAFASLSGDVDAGALQGVAMVAVDNTNGSWEYTLDGTNWFAIGNVSTSSARLLPSDATSRIRFVPNTDWNGATGITLMKAWDQTSGTAGSLADVAVNGGTTAFSVGTTGGNIVVAAVNDAPAVTIPAAQSLNQDATLTLSSGNGNQISVSDVDAASSSLLLTLSITDGTLTLNGTTGLILVSGGSGTSAMQYTGTLTNINAALNGMFYTPTANFSGGAGMGITIGDQGNTGSGGGLSDSKGLGITVIAVNDAPVLDNSGTMTLTTITEEDAANSGDAVGSIILSAGGDRITDVDSAFAFEGFAVTGLASGNGTWEYTINGTNWFAVGSVSDSSALLLRDTDRLRFVPDGQNGTVATVTFRAWDQTIGTQGTWVDVSANGGNTPYSTATETASITVSGVNDAPAVTIVPVTYSATEQASLLLQGTGISVVDVDAGAAAINLSLSVGSGTLTIDGGSTGISAGGPGSSVLIIGTLTQLNDLLAGNLGATITWFSASDAPPASTVLTASLNDGGTSGAGGPQSGADTAVINISAVNDEEVLATFSGSTVAENSAGNVIDDTRLLTTDADNASSQIIYTLSSATSNGTLRVNGSDLGTGGTFTQQDINAGLFTYDHDGSETSSDSFSFSVDDGAGTVSSGTFNLTITQVNDNNPIITSNGAGATAAISIAENSTAVTTVIATDSDLPLQTLSFSIIGGADAAGFSIDSATGVLRFVTAPDFEAPTDSGGNNVYDVTVQASDGAGLTDTQAISVSVTDLRVDVSNQSTGATTGSNLTLSHTTDGDNRLMIVAVSMANPGGNSVAGMTYNGDSLTFVGIETYFAGVGDEAQVELWQLVAPDLGTHNVVITLSGSNPYGTIAGVMTFSGVDQTVPMGVFASAGGDSAAATVNVASGDDELVFAAVTVEAGTANYVLTPGAGQTENWELFSSQVNSGASTEPGSALVTMSWTFGPTNQWVVGGVSIKPTQPTNAPPVMTSNGGGDDASISVAENTTAVTTVTASDADLPAQSLTYSISGGDDAARFTIASATGVLRFVAAPDSESPMDSDADQVYEVIVQVSDGFGGGDTQAINVTVTDANEFGTGGISDTNAVSNAVDENAAFGTVVGVTAFAIDPDATTSTITYTLDNNAGGRFSIDTVAGIVTVANGTQLDRESAASHTIIIRAASDDGSFSTLSVDISLIDVNEFDVSSAADIDATANLVAELSLQGKPVGITVSAVDADATNSAITWSLDSDAAGRFQIDAVTGVITVANGSLLDREVAGWHSIIARATSTDGSSSTQLCTINLLDIDEFDVAPITDVNAGTDSANENAATGTLVGITANAVDSDATNSTIFYSLDDSAGGRFAVDIASGVIAVADGSLLDYELATTHTILVRATSLDGSTTVRSFSISLVDVNDNAPVILPNQQFTVSELATVGTVVGDVGATDADTAGALQGWTITGGNPDGVFAINGATGQVTVADVTRLNFESSGSYTLTLTVSDGVSVSASQTIAIRVLDQNEAPVFAGSPTLNVNENSANGTVIGSVSASDQDAGNSLTYSLIGSGPVSPFAVDAVTGQIRVIDTSLLNFEAVTSVTLSIQVSDGAGLTDMQVVTISMNDVNEAPTDLVLSGGLVAENAAGGTVVGHISGSDPDAGEILNFSLINNAGSRFVIDGVTGTVTVAAGAVLNFESAATHQVIVRVTDLSGLFFDNVFTVIVTDVNEPPIAADDHYTTLQLTPLQVTVQGVLINDGDEDGDLLQAILVIGPSHGSLTLNLDGSLTYLPADLFSGADTFSYQVSDGTLSGSIVMVTIDVLQSVSPGGVGGTGPGTRSDSTDNHTTGGDSSRDSSSDDAKGAIASILANGTGRTTAAGTSASGMRSTTQPASPSELPDWGVPVEMDDANQLISILFSGAGNTETVSSGNSTGRNASALAARSLSTLWGGSILKLDPYDAIASGAFFSFHKGAETSNHEDRLDQHELAGNFVVGSTAVVTTSLSVGYVIWLLRGGSLLTAFMSALPAWQSFDPLPILNSFDREEEKDDVSLLDIATRKPAVPAEPQ